MKKTLLVLLALSLALAITACGTSAATSDEDPSATTPPPEASASGEAPALVTFTDPVLESLIRASIGKPVGDITSGDVEAVTRLDLSGEWQGYLSAAGIAPATIRDIGGLQAFTGLEHLDLSGHAISNITPLAGLTKLNTLILGGNPIADLTPLSVLTSLRLLDLSFCAASDYSPLEGLTSLERLNTQILLAHRRNAACRPYKPQVPLSGRIPRRQLFPAFGHLPEPPRKRLHHRHHAR